MTARRLERCPTCGRDLSEPTRQSMGLRTGEILSSLCPGRIGPSDIDHVLHNGRLIPERVFFFEYKDGVRLTDGQRILLRALQGDWCSRTDDRLLSVRFAVLKLHPTDPVRELEPIVEWLWPESDQRGAA